MSAHVRWLAMVPAALLTLTLVSPAAAQTTWNLSLGACDPTTNGSGSTFVGNTAGCTVDGISAEVTGWSSSSTSLTSTLQRATLTDQGGSGIGITSAGESTGSPNHAIDNNGLDELVLINFGASQVSLTGFATGWSYNDTDISVLRWTGTTGPDLTTMSLQGSSSGLITQGWELVTAQDIDGSNSNNNTTFGAKSGSIAGAAASSWWIISSYFGGTNQPLDMHNDYFKLLSFSGNKVIPPDSSTGVPEPGSLALAAAALFGLGAIRRRRKTR